MVSTIAIFAASLAAVASASPCKHNPTKTASAPIDIPTLLSVGSAKLTPPADDLEVKLITVGHGIQNYSCADTSAKPELFGALAVLHDIKDLYPQLDNASIGLNEFENISALVLHNINNPLNLQNPSAANPKNVSGATDSYAQEVGPFPSPADLDLSQWNLGNRKFVGHHFFSAGGVPTWTLPDAVMSGAVVEKIDGPAGANKGLLDTGAVGWLGMNSEGGGHPASTGDITYGYRLLVSGGVAMDCKTVNAKDQSIPYAAQYWFYGPKKSS